MDSNDTANIHYRQGFNDGGSDAMRSQLLARKIEMNQIRAHLEWALSRLEQRSPTQHMTDHIMWLYGRYGLSFDKRHENYAGDFQPYSDEL